MKLCHSHRCKNKASLCWNPFVGCFKLGISGRAVYESKKIHPKAVPNPKYSIYLCLLCQVFDSWWILRAHLKSYLIPLIWSKKSYVVVYVICLFYGSVIVSYKFWKNMTLVSETNHPLRSNKTKRPNTLPAPFSVGSLFVFTPHLCLYLILVPERHPKLEPAPWANKSRTGYYDKAVWHGSLSDSFFFADLLETHCRNYFHYISLLLTRSGHWLAFVHDPN